MGSQRRTLVLRLAGPLQAWGRPSEANRRETATAPSKSGVIGLLAAARGSRRGEPIQDLLGLELGVRVDRAGTVLRDYHTVSDYRGVQLLSSAVDRRGRQRPTSPKKPTAVTQRFYLQDAVFVAAVRGPAGLVESLATAVRRPAFPLALGRRSCVPTQPLLLAPPAGVDDLWDTPIVETLESVAWQGGRARRGEATASGNTKRLAAVVDAAVAPDGWVEDVADVPVSFDQRLRGFAAREVSHIWVNVPVAEAPERQVHGFALLGGE
jgi:CRISPR system Cascade subunit CasD